ncbi:DDE-type integrase/transposase/recombinase [Ketobacter sp. MCCC 1A13808]|nr:DDE-type integrase/transposase/recombinase [Ketobacter sp. MCCC 1A13808]
MQIQDFSPSKVRQDERDTKINALLDSGKGAKQFKATTNLNHNLPVAPNLLQQDFVAEAANLKWVGDNTYLWTGVGWLYLTVLLNLFSRKVVGWAMSERMTASLACVRCAINDAMEANNAYRSNRTF